MKSYNSIIFLDFCCMNIARSLRNGAILLIFFYIESTLFKIWGSLGSVIDA